ncbi:tyrosine--tRNA ligase [Chitinophaga sp. YIM B06452]|uniref:tyrosine--tRNA ligase n=1 Tax=Chitinophaga sp. YIM B06452 TaxID=3082158 RepID=UPI0031FEF9C6
MNLISELRWRGMIQDIKPGTEEQLQKEMTTAYIGFDPTADSLHVGSLVPIMLLVHLQKAGHKPLALVGGATGMVGDPSFKAEERKMLDEATLLHNQQCIKAQLERFLDFDQSKPNYAEMVNNYDWFKGISFLNFIRDVGKHITVNYMMAKDSVKKRLEGESGMSFTEFSYQMIQGYDFYHLYTAKNCKMQMGGSDQWGNIVTGTELVRRIGGGEAYAFTCPLIKKKDGSKFGKSESGNIWLDPAKTTPYQFYQFWLNADDEDAESYIRIFTFLDEPTINDLIAEHHQDPGKRVLQKRVAQEVTTFIHGAAEYEAALKTTESLFSKGAGVDTLKTMTEEQLLQTLTGVDLKEMPATVLSEQKDVVTFLAEAGVFTSKGEARKLIQGGGMSMNGQKITAVDLRITEESLLNGKNILFQKGKKNYILVKFV